MMACAMFGKLPSKRDFVSYNMPRPFLDHWEGWLQSAVAASRHALGTRWQEIFLGVPIWHFWSGRDVHGVAVTGALMPSVDGVGRYFPLTICACEPKGVALDPPPSPDLEQWHHECERLLLHMLEDEIERDPQEMLAALPFAPTNLREPPPQQGGDLLIWHEGNPPLASAFRSLRAMDADNANAARSLWWTEGGGGHRAQLVAVNGAPGPRFFEFLMTGALER